MELLAGPGGGMGTQGGTQRGRRGSREQSKICRGLWGKGLPGPGAGKGSGHDLMSQGKLEGARKVKGVGEA